MAQPIDASVRPTAAHRAPHARRVVVWSNANMLTCRLRSVNFKLKVVGGKLVVVNMSPHCQAWTKYSKPAREAMLTWYDYLIEPLELLAAEYKGGASRFVELVGLCARLQLPGAPGSESFWRLHADGVLGTYRWGTRTSEFAHHRYIEMLLRGGTETLLRGGAGGAHGRVGCTARFSDRTFVHGAVLAAADDSGSSSGGC